MARSTKQIDDQLTFDFSLDKETYVVQANDLIGGRQAMKLNSAKLIRAAVMQIVPEDTKLKPYIISIKDLSELLGISDSNLYRDIDDITNDIIKNPVYIRQVNSRQDRWVKIPWVSRCEYDSELGVAIRLNDALKPLLIRLKEHYTQYALENILCMKSVYAIRMFELLQGRIMAKLLPGEEQYIDISMQELRRCCGCEDKYPRFNNFKERVLESARKEINDLTMFRIKYDYIKTGKAVTAIKFHISLRSQDV